MENLSLYRDTTSSCLRRLLALFLLQKNTVLGFEIRGGLVTGWLHIRLNEYMEWEFNLDVSIGG